MHSLAHFVHVPRIPCLIMLIFSMYYDFSLTKLNIASYFTFLIFRNRFFVIILDLFHFIIHRLLWTIYLLLILFLNFSVWIFNQIKTKQILSRFPSKTHITFNDINKLHIASFPCTHHTLPVSHVSITPCQFPMYLSHLVSFPCTYLTL